MAPVMRAPMPLRVGADARCVSRAAGALGTVSTRQAPSRRAVLRRSTNGADALDLERVAQIEQEIIRQVRASRVWPPHQGVAPTGGGPGERRLCAACCAAGHAPGRRPGSTWPPPLRLTRDSHPPGVRSGSKSRPSGTPSPGSELRWRPSRRPWPPSPVRATPLRPDSAAAATPWARQPSGRLAHRRRRPAAEPWGVGCWWPPKGPVSCASLPGLPSRSGARLGGRPLQGAPCRRGTVGKLGGAGRCGGLACLQSGADPPVCHLSPPSQTPP